MDSSLLVSLSHQLAAYRSMDVIANNIANADTSGFRREEQTFHEYVEQLPLQEGQSTPQALSFVQDGGIVRDMTEGPLRRTGAPFDLAIHGKGFFAVQTPNGLAYTRNGHFSLDNQGQLVDDSGNALQSEGGAVSISVDDGDIHIGTDGTISGKKGQIGKLRVADFADESQLVKQGASLYSTTQQPNPAQGAEIRQGMLEESNVKPVVEISRMVEVMRSYQASATMTQSQEDLLRQAIDKLGQMPSS
ncbi:MAG: flagellar basal-body rod protein FlgF [Alphaproteobacteria bacterium]|nr:flagellar basal-body rod protein FlgF [Alphaproteobacteria bacterium]MBV9694004.1 flagellar basal-body rod protein FlgF [Alphaproteobacteria bacterium]